MKEDLRVKKTKTAVLNAFISLIEEKGFENVKIIDIANRANVNRNTIYLHYDSKEMIIEEIIDNIFTSQVTEQEFDEKFIPHLQKGEDILYISCSSALSQSGNLAVRLAGEKYKTQFPNSRIVVVDSLCSCMGQGSMLLRAAELRDQGKTIDEIADEINRTKLSYNQIATVEDLSTLAKHGRVKAGKAFFGNIFGVKPMIISDAKGNNYAVEKAKGRRNALIRLVEVVKERVIKPETQVCYVSHADARPEDVELVVSKIKELGFKDVVVGNLGPIISASCGPATFGVYYLGQEETRVGE